MARSYTLKRRAERQAETRQRIVEAAVELHGTLGPARTSLSMIADRAGVQRNTFYAHFPDERSLHLACSGLALGRAPPPDAAPWREIADPGERLREGLGAVYRWYGENAELIGCVLRDAEHHALTREMAELRLGPVIAGWHDALGSGRSAAQGALVHLALSYHAWRALALETGLDETAAADLMARAIEAV
jgi:AcrR family transcriptional regulator